MSRLNNKVLKYLGGPYIIHEICGETKYMNLEK